MEKELVQIDWDVNAAEKGGYEHFMLKEMYEQPKAIADTFSPRLKDGQIVIEELSMIAGGDPGGQQDHDRGLRFCLSHRRDGKICVRRPGQDPGGGGSGLGVPLPESHPG